MSKITDLKAARANTWAQMQEIRQSVEKDGWTAELRESWDKAEADLSTQGKDIEREERAKAIGDDFTADAVAPEGATQDAGELLERSADAPPAVDPKVERAYAKAFDSYIRHDQHDVTSDEFAALRAGFDPNLQRAQGQATGSIGGYTVPQGFWAKIVDKLKYYGGVNDNVEHLATAMGNDIPFPTNDDTGNVGAILGENATITSQDLAFGQNTLHAYKYTSKLILVSLELLQDTGVDVEGFIAKQAAIRLGRIWNTHFTTGTGTGQPQGLVTGATTGVTTAATNSVSYNELIDLEHSVDIAYRANAKFMFADVTLAGIRKIQDTQGHPLWQPSIAEGRPDTLNAKGIIVNNDMAVTGQTNGLAASTVGLFGDFNEAYVVRTVGTAQSVRLTERYMDALQIGFFVFARVDGLVQQAAAYRALVTHA